MKEYFVITDTHSFYDETMAALTKKKFDINNPEHIIIHCGDMFDRGPKSKEMLNFLWKLLQEKRLILVKGNHEELFKEMILYGEYTSADISNGTVKTLGHFQPKPLNQWETIESFDMCCLSYNRKFDDLFNAAVDYYETNNHIFVHGWIPVIELEKGKYQYDANWRNAAASEWVEARWTNGMLAAKQGVIEPNKTIVCGHWHASYGNVQRLIKKDPENKKKYEALEYNGKDKSVFKPFKAKGIIALDACTAISKFCNCLHFTEEDI